MHLSCRIARPGRGTQRHDAVDFREIVGREDNVCGAHILLEVLARLRTRYGYDEDPCTRALSHWPSDGELGERAGVFIVPIPGAKSRKHLEENVSAADIVLTADDLAEINRIVPPGAASGARYPIGQSRLNV